VLARDAREFLADMPEKHRRKAMALLQRLSELGPDLLRPHADALRGKIRELRCGFARLEYRFLYFFDGDRAIPTHGFLKKSAAVPERELRRAERFYDDFSREERRH
jgi:phage-related protein